MKLMILLSVLCASLSAHAIEFYVTPNATESNLLVQVSHPASPTGEPMRRGYTVITSKDGSVELQLSLEDRASQMNPDLYRLPLANPVAVLKAHGKQSVVELTHVEAINFFALASVVETKRDNCALHVTFRSSNNQISTVELVCHLPDSYLR